MTSTKTRRKRLRAKKYQVILKQNLVEEVMDHMKLRESKRGVLTRALGSIHFAVGRAQVDSSEFGPLITKIAAAHEGQHRVTLPELRRILGDKRAIEDIRRHGGGKCEAVFGFKVQAALGELVDATVREIDYGLFRT